MAGGQRDHLLDAVDVGGEGADHDAARCVPKDLLEDRHQVALLAADARPLRVRRIAEQKQHALVAELAEAFEIGWRAIQRIGIQLEVAGVDDPADGRLDGQGHPVGNAVADGHGLDPERPQLHPVAGAHLTQVRFAQDPVLLEPVARQSQRHPGAVDGHVETLEHEGQRADVVLVAVGEEDAEHPPALLEQPGHVGDHEVDSQHLLGREHEPGVHHQDLALPLQGPHVQADLAQPAKRHIPELRFRH